MSKLIGAFCFLLVVGVLWWALLQILPLFGLPQQIITVFIVVFVIAVVLAFVDYLGSGTWFWTRR